MEREYCYQVGDVVRIRPDIKSDIRYFMRSGPKSGHEPGGIEDVERYAGQVCTITSHAYGYYSIDYDNGRWCWSDEMLEPVEDQCVCSSLL